MSIENFLERNYINPIIRKFTDSHMKKRIDKKFKCGGCRELFEYEKMIAIKYGNKQILRCEKCMKKYKVRNIGKINEPEVIQVILKNKKIRTADHIFRGEGDKG